MKQKVRVWDIPTRLFHWSLVLSIGFMWFSAEQGGDWLAWHLRCGLFILALLVFRVCWGLWGSDTSRFAQFVKPTQIGRYLSGKLSENEQPGHNPVGALMVLALLAALFFQVGTGLFSPTTIPLSIPVISTAWLATAPAIRSVRCISSFSTAC